MRTSNVFNDANKLENYSVSVGEVSIPKMYISSLEISYSNSTCKILGQLNVNDIYDLNSTVDWKTLIVEVSYTDIFSETVNKSFRAINIEESKSDNGEKIISVELQDLFSFALETSYLSRGFNSNVIEAFNEYIAELGLDSHEIEIAAGEGAFNFVVPAHKNNLEFFENELKRSGYMIYQTKEKIVVKSLAELEPSKFEENDPKPYTDGTTNQLYKNKIYDLRPSHVKRVNLPPTTKALAYDPLTKTVKESESNEIASLSLNDDNYNMQETKGKREIVQNHLDFKDNGLNMRRRFMRTNDLMIVVNGYFKNDLNQIYSLELAGNKASVDSQNRGNSVLSGKWVSYNVIDKIMGNSMIQKINLERADTSSP